MPISSDAFPSLEEALNRLATESVLAQSGRDEGMVPAYSLLGDLRELCALEPVLREPVAALHVEFEKHLDAAKPFDDDLLGRLRGLASWLGASAVTSMKNGATRYRTSLSSSAQGGRRARARQPPRRPCGRR